MQHISELLNEQFKKIANGNELFRSRVSGTELWNEYMKGFGKDPVFRNPDFSVHNCSTCNNFIRRYGNIVGLDENYNIITMFDINNCPAEYKASFEAMANMLKAAPIVDSFVETFDELQKLPYERCKKNASEFLLGLPKNAKVYTEEEANKFPGVVKPGESRVFHHLYVSCPSLYIDTSGSSVASLMGRRRDKYNVFKRCMEEIPVDTYELVRDLINQGSLLDGTTHLPKVEAMIPLKKEYDRIPSDKQDNWCWAKSDFGLAKFKNELIGVLCTELAEGKDLNEACKEWNIRIDPANYMKAKAPITAAQIKTAQEFIEQNGFEESFTRRCATLDDIKAADILHINSGDGKIQKVSIFDGMKKAVSSRHKRSEFDKVEKVTIDKFMSDILPTCTSIELFLQSNQRGNFVTLTTSENKESKPIMKWSNNFSWTFNGNLAGKSQIKQAVKAAGGFVDAPFRFSIMWNEDWENRRVSTDLDAHAIEPTGTKIYYSTYKGHKTPVCGGMLDIDMICPEKTGVENIFWTDMRKVKDGAYKFFIHSFSGEPCTAKAEIVIGESIFQYFVSTPIATHAKIDIATVYIKNGELDHIDQSKWLTNSDGFSEEIYGLHTGEFQKVNLMCLSPNYWQEHGVGNKLYFFMLDHCKAPGKLRAFHNENLIPELLQHRKVLDVLGNTLQVESIDGQLSGLGFDSTVHDEIILRLGGTHKRIIKVEI